MRGGGSDQRRLSICRRAPDPCGACLSLFLCRRDGRAGGKLGGCADGAADMFAQPGIVRIVIGAVLLSNVRATWIGSHWKPESEEAAAFPPRFNDTLADKIADQWPRKLWPKLRIPYYVLGPLYVLTEFVGVIALRAGIVK